MSTKTEQSRIDVIINGASANASLRDLEAAARKAKSELRGLMPGTDEFKKAAANVARLDNALQNTRVQAGLTKSAYEKMKDSIKTSFIGNLGANLATLGLTKLAEGLLNGLQTYKQFQSSLKNLSAITGLAGDDLKYMGEQAQKASIQTGVGAKEIVEAYKLIASAKPELLENKEALAAITREAITLSHASGLELPEAAKRLTDAMNQFNAPAAEAGRYVNVLAEGARLSAAEVPDLTSALVEFGVAASAANVNIEESTALIETLAEKGVKGAEAGTKLRNVLIAMNAPEVLDKKALKYFETYGVNLDILSDKTQPFKVRLAELSKIQGDAGAIASIFGKENAIAAQILVENTGRVNELADALKKDGLNTAYDQAAKNTETLGAAQNKLSAAWDNIMTKQGAIGGFLTWMIQKFTNLLIVVDNLGAQTDLFFGGVVTASQKSKEYLIDFGKTETGKPLARYFELFEKMNNKDFFTQAAGNKQKFIDLMVLEGEKANEAGILFDAYARRRTDAMIASNKSRGNNYVPPPPVAPKKPKKDAEELEKEEAEKTKIIEKANKERKGFEDARDKYEMEQFKEKMYAQIDGLKELATVEEDLNKSTVESEIEQLEALKTKWRSFFDDLAKADKEKNQQMIDSAQQYANTTIGVIDRILDVKIAKENNELARDKRANDLKKKNLDDQLNKGIISKEKYDLKLNALNEQSDKREADLRRKQAVREKKFAVFIALVKVAAAWVEAYLVPAKIPQAILASAEAAALVAMPPPEFFDGGDTGAGGNEDSKGGFKAILHPNEYVVSAKQMRDPFVYNFTRQLEANKGNPSADNSTNSNSSVQPQILVQSDPELKALLRKLNDNGVKGVWNWDYEQRTNERMADLDTRRKL